jgi:hypothetical protein
MANGTVAVMTASDDGSVWTQWVDAAQGSTFESPVSLGRLNAGEWPLEAQPLSVPLPDGDLVLIGALGDGRISFVRGSRVAERRVAPRVVVEAEDTSLLGVAASATPAGIALLLLRRASGFDHEIRSFAHDMSVELYSIGAAGELTQPPIRFGAPGGSGPAVLRVGAQTFVMWHSGDTLITHFVADDGTRATRTLRLPAGRLPVTADLLATDGGVNVTVGQRRALGEPDLLPELLLAELRPSSADIPWRKLKLPGAPIRPSFNSASLAVRTLSSSNVLVVRLDSGKQLVSVDTRSGVVTTHDAHMPRNEDACIATGDGNFLCATAQRDAASSQCPVKRARIELMSTRALLPVEQTTDYWPAGQISDVDRRAPADRWVTERVGCMDSAFAPLRAALTAWCQSERRDDVFCGAHEPTSLLFQATNCRDYPESCPRASHRKPLSVDRRAFERGEAVELTYLSCSVAFERNAAGWAVVNGECEGD